MPILSFKERIIANFIKMNPKYASKPLMSEQELAKQCWVNPPKSTLNKIVISRIKEMKTLLGEREDSTNEIAKSIQICVDNLQLDLADFRRKVLDLGAVEPSKVEPKEAKQDNPKQDSPTLSELEQGKVWIIQTNPKKVERLNAFYLEKVSADGLVIHTPNSSEALQFSTAMEAQIKAANIISCAGGRYKSDDFKIVAIEAKQPENEADKTEQSEPILPAPQQKEADKDEIEQPEVWLIYDKIDTTIMMSYQQPTNKSKLLDNLQSFKNIFGESPTVYVKTCTTPFGNSEETIRFIADKNSNDIMRKIQYDLETYDDDLRHKHQPKIRILKAEIYEDEANRNGLITNFRA